MGRSNETTPDIGNSMTIVHGKWTERVPEGTPGATPRTLTKGKNAGSTVYEIGWKALKDLILLSGKVVKPEGFTGEQVELTCRDIRTGESFVLSLSADSKYTKTFIMCLPQLDKTQPFDLELHLGRGKTPTGDDKFNLRVIQEGRPLKTDYFLEWKKDGSGKNITIYHNGCPPPVEKRGGKLDFDDQNGFLLDYLEDFFEGYSAPNVSAPVAEEQEDDDLPDDIPLDGGEDDDIPF